MFLAFTMNLDHTMDQDVEQFHPHMTPAASEDIVRWQSSQSSCPALEALLVESLASERGVSRPETRSSQWDLSASSPPRPSPWSKPGSSGSSGSISRARPPGLRSNRVTHTTPDQNRGSTHILALIQGVSAQVDDNTQRKTKIFARDRELKATLNDSGLKESKPSTNQAKGKGKASIASHRILPNPSAKQSMDVGSSVGSTAEGSRMTNVAPPLSSVPNRVTRSSTDHAPPIRSHMLPPPVPVPAPELKPDERGQQRDSNPPHPIEDPLPPKRTSPQSNPPPVKVHPLVHQPHTEPKPHPHPLPKPAQHRPKVHHPRFSQPTSRPPILGMRRVSPYPSFTPSQSLPAKQKGFKPPFSKRPSATSSPASSTASLTPKREASIPEPQNSSASSAVLHTSPYPTPSPAVSTNPIALDEDSVMEIEPSITTKERSSSPMAETDSSFGDLSFDLDALEEAMKQYD